MISDNHFTQPHLRGTWGVKLASGVRFSHNLLHDAPGQLVTPNGPLSMLDHNEIFNTGFMEGDGGVTYAGASLTAGYGMQYRENFIHHSLRSQVCMVAAESTLTITSDPSLTRRAT